jgi:hypothetical protein
MKTKLLLRLIPILFIAVMCISFLSATVFAATVLPASSNNKITSIKVRGIEATAVKGSANAYKIDLPYTQFAFSDIAITMADPKAKVQALQTADGGTNWTFDVAAEDTTVAGYSFSIATHTNIEYVKVLGLEATYKGLQKRRVDTQDVYICSYDLTLPYYTESITPLDNGYDTEVMPRESSGLVAISNINYGYYLAEKGYCYLGLRLYKPNDYDPFDKTKVEELYYLSVFNGAEGKDEALTVKKALTDNIIEVPMLEYSGSDRADAAVMPKLTAFLEANYPGYYVLPDNNISGLKAAVAGSKANPRGTPGSGTFTYKLARRAPAGDYFVANVRVPIQINPVQYPAEPQGTVMAAVIPGQEAMGAVTAEFLENVYNADYQCYFSTWKITVTPDMDAGYRFKEWTYSVTGGVLTEEGTVEAPPTQIGEPSLTSAHRDQNKDGYSFTWQLGGGVSVAFTADFAPNAVPVLPGRTSPEALTLSVRQAPADISFPFTDPDNDRLTYRLLVDGELFGTVNDLNTLPGWNEPGKHEIRVVASDGNAETTHIVEVTVVESPTVTPHRFNVTSNLPLTGPGGVGAVMAYTAGTNGIFSIPRIDGERIDSTNQYVIKILNYGNEVKPAHPLKCILFGSNVVVPGVINQQAEIEGASDASGSPVKVFVREITAVNNQNLMITIPALTNLDRDVDIRFVFRTDAVPKYSAAASSADAAMGSAEAIFIEDSGADGNIISHYHLKATPAAGCFIDYWEYRAAGSNGEYTRLAGRDGQTNFVADASGNTELRVRFYSLADRVELTGDAVYPYTAEDLLYAGLMLNKVRDDDGKLVTLEPLKAKYSDGVGRFKSSYDSVYGEPKANYFFTGQLPLDMRGETVDAYDNAILWFTVEYYNAVDKAVTVRVYAGEGTGGTLIREIKWTGMQYMTNSSAGLGYIVVPVDFLPSTDKVTVELTVAGFGPVVKTYPLSYPVRDTGLLEERLAAALALRSAYEAHMLGFSTPGSLYSSEYLMLNEEYNDSLEAVKDAATAEAIVTARDRGLLYMKDAVNSFFHSGVEVGVTMGYGFQVVTVPAEVNARTVMTAALEQAFPNDWYLSTGYGGGWINGAGSASKYGKPVGVLHEGQQGGVTYGVTTSEGRGMIPWANGVMVQQIFDHGFVGWGDIWGGGPPKISIYTNGPISWDMARLLMRYDSSVLLASDTFYHAYMNLNNSKSEAAYEALQRDPAFADFLAGLLTPAVPEQKPVEQASADAPDIPDEEAGQQEEKEDPTGTAESQPVSQPENALEVYTDVTQVTKNTGWLAVIPITAVCLAAVAALAYQLLVKKRKKKITE